MAEHWQKWMPFYIDRFRGSPDVQAMHPIARIGYLYLLASAWQTDTCTLPNDGFDLANLSGLGEELWTQHSPRILRKFKTLDSGRLQNVALLAEWDKARGVFLSRSKSAKDATAKRLGKHTESVTVSNDSGDRTVSESRPLRSVDTMTMTSTDTKTKAKTDTRPALVVSECTVSVVDLERVYKAYPRQVGKAKALEAIRKAVKHLQTGRDWPKLTAPDALCLLHEKVRRYARSPAGNAGDYTPHPATWFNGMRYLDDEREWEHGRNQGNSGAGGRATLGDRVLDELRRANAADSYQDFAGADGRRTRTGDGRGGAAVVLEGAR